MIRAIIGSLSIRPEPRRRRDTAALANRKEFNSAELDKALITLGERKVFRHVVSNFKDVLAVLESRTWPLALGGHFHTRESIRYESSVRTRFELAAAVVGPTSNAVPAMSGVTLYRVKNLAIDAGEFIRLP